MYVRGLRTIVSYPTKMSYLLQVTDCYDEIDQYSFYVVYVETNHFDV